MRNYDIRVLGEEPLVSVLYMDVADEYKLSSKNLDLSRLGRLTLGVLDTLIEDFELYYADREIAGESEYGFFRKLQSCLNRNADTIERQLEVYDKDIAKPILGRTEKTTYDTTNERKIKGNNIDHHIEVPADSPEYDKDRTRDKNETDSTDTTTQTGTVELELSDIGVRPNYEMMNGFLKNNITKIQFFIDIFQECFSPRIKEIYI